MGKPLVGFIAALGLGLGFAGSSTAAPITWIFEGQVAEIQNASPATLGALSSLGVSPSSSFSGVLVFDSATPDANSDPSFGRYNGPILSFDVTIASLHIAIGPGGRYGLMIVNSADSLLIANASGPGISSIFDAPTMALQLWGEIPGLFASDALPAFPPELESLHPYGVNETFFFMSAPDARIYGELTQLSPASVPEPAIFALVAAAALAFAVLRYGACARRPRSGRAGAAGRPGS